VSGVRVRRPLEERGSAGCLHADLTRVSKEVIGESSR
jgi:hypothetical protein